MAVADAEELQLRLCRHLRKVRAPERPDLLGNAKCA